MHMYGSHLSIAGGLHNALIEARSLKMDCVQVFTKNQRQWTVPPLDEDQVNQWQQQRRETGIDTVVSHGSYLINLASPANPNRLKSLALFREELRRCETLNIPWLVTHPGSHLNEGGTTGGLKRVAKALDQLHRDLPGLAVRTCLEVTAGQGTNLGSRFEELQVVMNAVRAPERLAVCLDTAHMLAAGYDLSSAAGAEATLSELDHILGLESVTVLHVNDSKAVQGSRVDRHAHIGQGHVAREAFAVLLGHPRFKTVPKILETPKGDDSKGRPWDRANLARLQRIAKAPGRKYHSSKREGRRLT